MRFLLKNPDFLLKNPDFLLKNVDFLLKNVDFILQQTSLQHRDPQGIGLPSAEGRDLLRQLLRWNAEDRITAMEALDHPYLALSGADR